MKKLIISLVALSVLVIAGTIFVEENLAKYTVYYAQHLPHKKGRHPVPILILENLDWLEQPSDIGYEYDTYEAPIIYSDKEYIQRSSEAIVYSDKKNNYYHFSSKNDKLTGLSIYEKDSTYTDPNSKEFKAVNQEKVWKEIDTFLEPLVKAQPRPKIDLQWLFNKRYEKRFNE